MEEAFFRIAVDQRPYIRSAPFSPHKRPGFQEEEPVALAPAYHQYNRAAGSALWQLIEANFGSLQCVVVRCSPMSAEGRGVTYYPVQGSIDRSQTIQRFSLHFCTKHCSILSALSKNKNTIWCASQRPVEAVNRLYNSASLPAWASAPTVAHKNTFSSQ